MKFCNLQGVIEAFKGFYRILNNAIYNAKYGRLKISTYQQMIPRSLIELAQIKAGNKFEN